ncbi:hypothetical protein Leryth_022626 [Lithospermum erythrorhizon]|uniref:MADS box transcription factor n=1 Tax=Lithospermum erythrorhizon TaxID=34254 RepID=A0AAV3P4N8_LITER|nr:hypothetical protein Leryth_022626 [Lithospermum erythrorhizon]
MENIVKKKNMGRQKIEIKKMEKKDRLQVTFSKRRKGLFKKVEEFSKLCGGDAAVLVRSPGGKPFSWGTPSVEHVINRYIGLNNDDAHQNISSGSSVTTEINGVCENMLVGEAMKEKEIGKKQSFEELKGDELFWWNKSIDDLDLQQLEEFKVALERLKSTIMARANTMLF